MSREKLLLVSSLEKLRQRYGQAGLDKVLSSVEAYRDSLSSRRVELTTAFVDDRTSITQFGLKPLKTITSTSVKTAIDSIVAKLSAPRDASSRPPHDTGTISSHETNPKAPRTVHPHSLDDVKARSSRDSNISILILGGGEVIPYFRLPNPAFDSDSSVFSDNPYGCPPKIVSLEKCLLPQIPVGRMPDGNGSDVGLLLGQIQAAREAAMSLSTSPPSFQKSSFGYTAGIWKKASQEVWRGIGYTGSLKVCPPLSDADVTSAWFNNRTFLYFNVHGSNAEPFWFGQDATTFPKALSPAHVSRFCHERSMIVTEACYGAIEMDRQKETSIPLAFLSSGSACVIGSTCTAYGAFTPPVSEADLIALHFFRNVHKGVAFGMALVRARAQLAAVAVSRQGYLDEDDKKTLLQFVLFGDPTITVLPLFPGSGEDAKNTKRSKTFKKG